MTAWMVVVLAGAGSFAMRACVVLMIDRLRTPEWLERLAGYVVPAAFTGLAATALAGPLGAADAEAGALLGAVVMTLVLAWRGRSVQLAFGAGVLTLWAITGLASLA